MENSEAPLISGDEERSSGEQQASRPHRISPPKSPFSRPEHVVVALTFAAGISGLLFGYDTGVVSSTLVSINDSLSHRELTSIDKSIITSATSLFALLTSPFSSILADRLGRKKVILYADILFVAGALIQAVSSTVLVMVFGRCIIGAAVGAASFVVPLYIAEIAPAAHRGRLVTTNVVFVTLGQMVAYIVGWLLSIYGPPATAWRWMVGLGAVPAALQAGLLVMMPDTPRWLIKVGRQEEARAVIESVHSPDEDVDAIVALIEREAREEREARVTRSDRSWMGMDTWRELVHEGKNRRALIIACLLQGLQQLCGFNSLMYFSATIFTMVGFSNPILASLTVAITNFVFTVVALVLIDRVGRRKMLLASIPFMVAGLLLTSAAFTQMKLPTAFNIMRPEPDNTVVGSVILASIAIYVASYAVGLGNVPWMQSELFPLSVRSLGSGLATATNWSANFVVGLTFLPLMEFMTPTLTFVMYALICAAGYWAVYRVYPETAGLSLEETTALLEHGWGVRR